MQLPHSTPGEYMDLSAQGKKRRAKDEEEGETEDQQGSEYSGEIKSKQSERKKGKICATSILPPIPQGISQNITLQK